MISTAAGRIVKLRPRTILMRCLGVGANDLYDPCSSGRRVIQSQWTESFMRLAVSFASHRSHLSSVGTKLWHLCDGMRVIPMCRRALVFAAVSGRPTPPSPLVGAPRPSTCLCGLGKCLAVATAANRGAYSGKPTYRPGTTVGQLGLRRQMWT